MLDSDQLWLVPDKWCWVLYVDCVSLTPSMSLDACILATTAALQNGMVIVQLVQHVAMCTDVLVCMLCMYCVI